MNKHICHEDVVATLNWWSVRMRCQFLIAGRVIAELFSAESSTDHFASRVIAELILPSRQLTISELRWLRDWWETRLLLWPFSDFPSRTALTWGLQWSYYDGWGLGHNTNSIVRSRSSFCRVVEWTNWTHAQMGRQVSSICCNLFASKYRKFLFVKF